MMQNVLNDIMKHIVLQYLVGDACFDACLNVLVPSENEKPPLTHKILCNVLGKRVPTKTTIYFRSLLSSQASFESLICAPQMTGLAITCEEKLCHASATGAIEVVNWIISYYHRKQKVCHLKPSKWLWDMQSNLEAWMLLVLLVDSYGTPITNDCVSDAAIKGNLRMFDISLKKSWFPLA